MLPSEGQIEVVKNGPASRDDNQVTDNEARIDAQDTVRTEARMDEPLSALIASKKPLVMKKTATATEPM